MIKFDEGYNKRDFIFFRTADQGDMYLKDERPFIELALVVKSPGGATRSTLSWDGNWNFRVKERFVGDSKGDEYVNEIKCNMLYRDWDSLLKYLKKKGLFTKIFDQLFI